jgi:hypothetical protein
MKQVKKDVRTMLRTSSFGFTLIETLVTLLLNTWIFMSFVHIVSFNPIHEEDSFIHEKIKIRSYQNLFCLDQELYHDQEPLYLKCLETHYLIEVYIEEKVFYVKKYEGIHNH